LLKTIVLLLAALTVTPSFASSDSEALSQCFADNTTGKDRKDLARWVFVAMSVHPEIRDISNVTPKVIDDASKVVGALFTRLLTQSCQKEVRAAMQSGGSSAPLQEAGRVLGELAMKELMADRNVAASFSVLNKYVDMDKLNALGRQP